MAISENNAHYGHRLRVYRKIGDTIYDEVFYLTDKGKPVPKTREKQIRAAARARDKELETIQIEFYKKMEAENPIKFHRNGRIVGLSLRMSPQNNQQFDCFKLRLRTPDNNYVWGSFSIEKYGFEGAYTESIKRIAKIYNINTRSKLYRDMKAAQSAYS